MVNKYVTTHVSLKLKKIIHTPQIFNIATTKLPAAGLHCVGMIDRPHENDLHTHEMFYLHQAVRFCPFTILDNGHVYQHDGLCSRQ